MTGVLPGVLPLTAHRGRDAVLAHGPGGPVTVARFLADVARLAGMLPPGGHLLNLCQDRYRFMVGFAAALVAGRVTLLPAAQAPETLRQLQAYAPDLFCLHDGEGADLPGLRYPDDVAAPDPALPMPEIPADRVAAILFTSGSTGAPMPHGKTWGALVASGRAEAHRLGVAGYGIVGTVPPQHAYGLESTIMLSLHGGCAAWSGRPFYPADIAAALAAVPRPRLLVTTPFHLRTLLDAGVAVPPVDLLLSATAPLSAALAGQAEAQLAAPLHEIYGCTECGQLASRRTNAATAWQPLEGVRLELEGDQAYASGGHVAGRVPLADLLELLPDGTFLLQGRSADLINIAGKRTSLAFLNHQLNSLPGVADGCFFLPDEAAADGITRLAAFAVAPGQTAGQLLAALRLRLDPIFLPRPLLLVDRLPRNATGKLTRQSLQALLAAHRPAGRAGEGGGE